MPITLITGPANAGKAELVLDGVRRELAHGSEPLLVVPTRADAEHYLRELAGDAVAMGVRVERFAGLLDEVAVRAGVAEPVLGAIARDRLLQALARRGSRVGDGSVSDGPAGRGFVRALGELFAELQVRRVTPARLSRALERWREADGIGVERPELGGLFAAYRSELQRLRLLDRDERSVRALDALRERPSLWSGTPVAFYGFDDLTTLQLDAIETLGAIVPYPAAIPNRSSPESCVNLLCSPRGTKCGQGSSP